MFHCDCVCVAERSAWSERLVVVLVVVVAVVGVWGLLWRKRKFKIGIDYNYMNN